METTVPARPADDPLARLMNLATGYWGSAALLASVELGIWEALATGPRTTADLARACGASAEHIADLADALVSLGLLDYRDGRLATAPSVAPFLDPSSPRCLLSALRMNGDLYSLWGRLAETVRNGRPPAGASAHLGDDPGRTRRFALAMHSRALAMADAILPAINLGGGTTLLDLGAGPGTFSRLLAERTPSLRVTQLDLPPVLAVARELTANSPAADRIEFLEGDYHTLESFGGPFDAVLYCGALHQEDSASATDLFRRARSAVKPGGRLIMVDLMRAPGRTHPMACLFSLNMRLTSRRGRVFTVAEAEQILAQSGFRVVRSSATPGLPYWTIEACPASGETAP